MASERELLTIAGREVAISNPGKLFFPALVIGGLVATAALVARVEATVATVVVTAGAVVILFALERVRPQRRRRLPAQGRVQLLTIRARAPSACRARP